MMSSVHIYLIRHRALIHDGTVHNCFCQTATPLSGLPNTGDRNRGNRGRIFIGWWGHWMLKFYRHQCFICSARHYVDTCPVIPIIVRCKTEHGRTGSTCKVSIMGMCQKAETYSVVLRCCVMVAHCNRGQQCMGSSSCINASCALRERVWTCFW
jgi:hypothetical protein